MATCAARSAPAAGILVRVGPTGYERALARPYAKPMEMRGRVAVGFVRVMPDGYRTDAALRKWIQRGLDFVATLPAKTGRSSRKATARNRRQAK
jgi:hypothetical protein